MSYPLSYRSALLDSEWPIYTPLWYRRPLSMMLEPYTIEPVSYARRDPLLDSYPQITSYYRRPQAWDRPKRSIRTPLLWDYPSLRPHGTSYGYLWAKSRSWLSDWYA